MFLHGDKRILGLSLPYIAYSLDDTSGDTSFSSFAIDNAPSYLYEVLADIYAVNKNAKVYVIYLCLFDILSRVF